ncbi:MAG: GAF domain-containing sensor histidine kinase [Candidatus Gastranaerophilales bacterium]|nr:GAF domain-containing sensor histidine kinase [Candidatus Gastranaerophilales bacterium]
MTKVFLLLNLEDNQNKEIVNLLEQNQFELAFAQGNIEENILQINNFLPDLILIDNKIEHCEFTLRQIKTSLKHLNIQTILLKDSDKALDFIALADGLIELPLKIDTFLFTINSHIKTKNNLDRLYENNKELSRSLYQLNVLYNTSSQFAGTLNTNKLYDIMLEAMEKTLSFDVSAVLVFNSDFKPVFSLNSLYTPTENLVDALKIRSVLNYKTIFESAPLLVQQDFENIETIQKIKQTRSNKVFGLESISFDSLFAPIKVGDDFFGVIELFRQKPFSSEDVTCFQAITHQVALPLRSAKLYEEISVANKKLEKLEKIKSEFVSIVSHELRTPLTPINNSLEIILNGQAGEITEDTRNFISMTKRNILRLSGIIEDLLDLSRIQTGKLDLKYKLSDITSSLELMQKTFEQVANEKEIKFSLLIDEKLPEVYIDSRRIEQIFTNLISNSLKFTSANGEISLGAKVIDDFEIDETKLISPIDKPNGKYIQVTVKDTGVGIKKEDIPKIFDKFSQIESTLNRNKGGVGLGLTITKQLIDSHLGLIFVDSEEKVGSEFNVLIPISDDVKTFTMDLLRSLTNNDDVGLIKINHKKDLNLIEDLKNNKMLNLSRLSKEIVIEKEDIVEYCAFIPHITLASYEAMVGLIDNYSKQINANENDIIISSLHSAKNGKDAVELVKKLGLTRG